MPRYFMHLRDGTDEILDPEGVLLSADAVAPAALAAARDCIAGDVRHDESDAVVHSLHFIDAVSIHSPSTHGSR
jgi:hypothetical protein